MSETAKKSGEQKDAEAEVDSFRKALGPFVVAAETTRMPMVFTDAQEPDHPIIFANDSFLSLTGHDREEVLGDTFNSLLARGVSPESQAEVKACFDGNSDRDPEINYRRKDGSQFCASLFISPVRDESGKVIQHFVSFVDQSKHKADQAHGALLIEELNHRVKNTLSTVQSIVWQAFRRASDPAVIREAIETRLYALARSHDLLTREKWQGAGLADLVNAVLEPFGVANGRAERFLINSENIRLTPKATLALGITLHELATNAVKYGAFSNEIGTVLLSWTIEPAGEGERLIIRWREQDGPPVAPPLPQRLWLAGDRAGFAARTARDRTPRLSRGRRDVRDRHPRPACRSRWIRCSWIMC